MLRYELKIYSTDNDIVGSNSDNNLQVLKKVLYRFITIGIEGIKKENGLNENITPHYIIIHDNKKDEVIDRYFLSK
jgi:hypothetical protein